MSDRSVKVLYGILVVAICAIVVGPLAYCAHVRQRLSFWDRRVTELCRKDGGTTVYEAVAIGVTAREQADFWASVNSPKTDKPYKVIKPETIIHKADPIVSRLQLDYLRSSTNKLLGTTINYYRHGGDPFIVIDDASRFSCTHLPNFVGRSDGIIFVTGPYMKELE